MNATLVTAQRVAFHPNMIKLRQQMDAMRRRLNNDYGANFMGIEIKDATDAKTEADSGKEGINRWTPVERKQWFTLEARIRGLRAALTQHYTNVA